MPPATPSNRFMHKRPTKPVLIDTLDSAKTRPSEEGTQQTVSSSASLRGDASDQFSSVPRFQQRKPPTRQVPERWLPDNAAHSFAEVLAAANLTQTAIDTAAHDDEVMLLDQAANAPADVSQIEQWSTLLPLSPKRARDQDEREEHSSAVKAHKRPAAFSASSFRSVQPPEPPRRRFTYSAATHHVSSQLSAAARSPFLQRPATANSPSLSVPLPEAFSPHRRGPRFVPGGMAETLHRWTIEVGQTAEHAKRAQTRGHEETYVLELVVSELLSEASSRPTMLSGKTDDGTAVSVLLIDTTPPNAHGDDNNIVPLRRSQILGLREPCWSVTACHRRWVVCIDWKVLGP